MPQITHSLSVAGGGISIQSAQVVREGSGVIGLQETLALGQAGTLTTRTSDTAGTITASDAGHGIATADKVDVHWTDSGVPKVAYDCTVGTVAGTSIPFTGASGDVLPIATSAIVVTKHLSVNLSIDGDETKLIAIVVETADITRRDAVHIQFLDSGSAEIAELDLVTNIPQVWDIEGGASNPFTGNPITVAKITNGGTTASQNYTLKIAGVQDASP